MALCISIPDSNPYITTISSVTIHKIAHSHCDTTIHICTHRQTGLEMKFVLILPAEYTSESEVDSANLPKLKDLSQTNNAIADALEHNTDNSDEALDVSDNDESEGNGNGNDYDSEGTVLESQELTETEKESVNDTAKFIVYGVIIALAAVFAFGICALLYWWGCHRKCGNGMSATQTKDSMIGDSDETQPFIDIRSENTLRKQTLALEREKSAKNESRFYLEKGNGNGSVSVSVGDVYHDIVNSVNENESESGDDMIRHYGAIDHTH